MRQVKNKMKRVIALCLLFTLVVSITPEQSMAASVAKPKLKSATIRIGKGQSQKIKIVNVKSKQIKKITYSSSKESVAKVSKKGNVTGVKTGNTTITCKVTLKNKKRYTLKAKINVIQTRTTTYAINDVAFKMVYVKAGTFTMGSNKKNVAYSESPAHKVTLTRDYYMGETEVTEVLWNAVMGSGRSRKTMPKTSVTWKQAHTFVDKLNQIAHNQNLIKKNQNFILPTEAQWEFAARGGNLSKGYKYSGSDNIDDVAQTLENTGSNSPVAVKGKQPNELGLYDMSGNAYEWVNDYAGDYSAEDQRDPQNTTKSGSYVKRGGSNYHNYSSEPYLFTSTGRYFYGSTDWTIGFRIALAEK